METILAKKANEENPIATDDDHHAALVKDPDIPQFPQTTGTNMPTQPVNSNDAGTNAAQDADVLVVNNNEDWINKKWRPMMGWMYMIVCTADFVVFPVLWSILQAVKAGSVTSQWQPLTLQGAGLFHIAMGAVLGIAAYDRTKEKLESATKN